MLPVGLSLPQNSKISACSEVFQHEALIARSRYSGNHVVALEQGDSAIFAHTMIPIHFAKASASTADQSLPSPSNAKETKSTLILAMSFLFQIFTAFYRRSPGTPGIRLESFTPGDALDWLLSLPEKVSALTDLSEPATALLLVGISAGLAIGLAVRLSSNGPYETTKADKDLLRGESKSGLATNIALYAPLLGLPNAIALSNILEASQHQDNERNENRQDHIITPNPASTGSEFAKSSLNTSPNAKNNIMRGQHFDAIKRHEFKLLVEHLLPKLKGVEREALVNEMSNSFRLAGQSRLISIAALYGLFFGVVGESLTFFAKWLLSPMGIPAIGGYVVALPIAALAGIIYVCVIRPPLAVTDRFTHKMFFVGQPKSEDQLREILTHEGVHFLRRKDYLNNDTISTAAAILRNAELLAQRKSDLELRSLTAWWWLRALRQNFEEVLFESFNVRQGFFAMAAASGLVDSSRARGQLEKVQRRLPKDNVQGWFFENYSLSSRIGGMALSVVLADSRRLGNFSSKGAWEFLAEMAGSRWIDTLPSRSSISNVEPGPHSDKELARAA